MQEVEVEEDWTDADEADVPLDSAPLDDGLVAQGPGAEFADDALQAKPGSSKRQKKGVVYISRIPPHLVRCLQHGRHVVVHANPEKPQKLRHLLEQHGELGRLYLAPEAPSLRAKRKRHKGNTGKNFTEGWVEFEDMRVAKQVASMLNGQQMGGKRRSAYHYDLWCLKYLPNFKWESLTEEIAYQRAVHDQKLAMEISAAKRERDFYLSRIDKSKGIAAMQQRRAQQAGESESAPKLTPAEAKPREQEMEAGDAQPKRVRAYGQRKPKADSVGANASSLPPSLLSLIAGRPQT